MEAVCSSETSVNVYRITRGQIPEDSVVRDELLPSVYKRTGISNVTAHPFSSLPLSDDSTVLGEALVEYRIP
jgi:hypothetical protein